MGRSSLCRLSLVVVLIAAVAPVATAQATRTWVSGVGDDANPCSRTAPCKTYAGAISKTAAGGEISTLDPGGFGAVTITKSITISGDGTLGGILASLTNGVIVNAGVNDRVVLRNLSIHGAGNGLNGIRFLAGKSLVVENVTISGFTTRGIDMSMTTNGHLLVRDSHINSSGTGIRVTTTSGQARAMLDNVDLSSQTNGLDAGANSRVTISDSTVANNTQNGIMASSATARVGVDRCQVSFNELTGVNSSVSGAVIRLSDSAIYHNNTGIGIAAGASVDSTGDNRVEGNVGSAQPTGVITVR